MACPRAPQAATEIRPPCDRSLPMLRQFVELPEADRMLLACDLLGMSSDAAI